MNKTTEYYDDTTTWILDGGWVLRKKMNKKKKIPLYSKEFYHSTPQSRPKIFDTLKINIYIYISSLYFYFINIM